MNDVDGSVVLGHSVKHGDLGICNKVVQVPVEPLEEFIVSLNYSLHHHFLSKGEIHDWCKNNEITLRGFKCNR